MPNSISVEAIDGCIAGAYPHRSPGIPCVNLFIVDPMNTIIAKLGLSPVNAMALASTLVGAAEYVLPDAELRDAEEDAYAEEVNDYIA